MFHVGHTNGTTTAAVVADEPGREYALVANHHGAIHRPVRDERHIVVRHFAEPHVAVPLVRSVPDEVDLAVAGQTSKVGLALRVLRTQIAVAQLKDSFRRLERRLQVIGLAHRRRKDAREASILGLDRPATALVLMDQHRCKDIADALCFKVDLHAHIGVVRSISQDIRPAKPRLAVRNGLAEQSARSLAELAAFHGHRMSAEIAVRTREEDGVHSDV